MPAADPVAQWKKRRETGGKITLPSGQEVRIEVPNLPEMLRADQVPNPLIKFATESAETIQAGLEISKDKIKETTDFMRWMVSATVKDPSLTPDDIPSLPTEDTEMILEFAIRARDTDAVGHQLHGLEKLTAWNNFRQRGRFQ